MSSFGESRHCLTLTFESVASMYTHQLQLFMAMYLQHGLEISSDATYEVVSNKCMIDGGQTTPSSFLLPLVHSLGFMSFSPLAVCFNQHSLETEQT